MFQSLFACPPALSRASSCVASDRLVPAMLAAGTAAGLLAVVATWPSSPPPIPGTPDTARPLTLTLTADSSDASLAGLRDRAEAVRARALALPGVGSATVTGLVQQRLIVETSPARLAAFGLTEADIAAAIGSDPAASTPGRLAVGLAHEAAGLQAVEDLPVRAGARIVRLGDVALVARARLDPPVSTWRVDGRPAVRITITPARGADLHAVPSGLAPID